MARTIVARQADFSIGLRNSEGNSTGWLVDITYSCARHGVCREFTPVFAKHLRSFWLIDSLAIGVDRMKRNFGPMQKKGRKGGALERRELTVVVTAEVDCFRSADQPGTTPFVDIRAHSIAILKSICYREI